MQLKMTMLKGSYKQVKGLSNKYLPDTIAVFRCVQLNADYSKDSTRNALNVEEIADSVFYGLLFKQGKLVRNVSFALLVFLYLLVCCFSRGATSNKLYVKHNLIHHVDSLAV